MLNGVPAAADAGAVTRRCVAAAADTAIVPLSGGGLVSGIALALKSASPDIRVIGVSMQRGAAMRDIEAGITYINGPTIGAEVHLPFGGVKDTGNGHREAGTTVYDIFSEWKSIYVDYSGKLQKAQIDNVE